MAMLRAAIVEVVVALMVAMGSGRCRGGADSSG